MGELAITWNGVTCCGLTRWMALGAAGRLIEQVGHGIKRALKCSPTIGRVFHLQINVEHPTPYKNRKFLDRTDAGINRSLDVRQPAAFGIHQASRWSSAPVGFLGRIGQIALPGSGRWKSQATVGCLVGRLGKTPQAGLGIHCFASINWRIRHVTIVRPDGSKPRRHPTAVPRAGNRNRKPGRRSNGHIGLPIDAAGP